MPLMIRIWMARFTLLTGLFCLAICWLIPQSVCLSAETAVEKYLNKLQNAPEPDEQPPTKAEQTRPRTPTEENRLKSISHYMAARLLFERNSHKQALAELEKAAQLDPSAADVYELLIPLAIGLNQGQLVDKYLTNAETADPDNYQLLMRVGKYLQSQKKFAEAARVIQRAVQSPHLSKTSGEYVLYNFELGILLSLIRKPVEACEPYSIVFDALTHPDKYEMTARVKTQLMADRARTLDRIGRAFIDGEQLDQAEEAFKAAAEFGSGKPGVLGYNLAQIYLKKKEYEKGLTNLQSYFDARLQTKGATAYRLLKELLEGAEKKEELITRLEALAEKDPRNSKLKFFLAEQYIDAERLEDAEKLITSTLETTGGTDGYVGLSEIYYRKREPEKLLDAMSEAFNNQANLQVIQDLMDQIQEDVEFTNEILDIGDQREAMQLDFSKNFLLANLATSIEKTPLVIKFYRQAIAQRRRQAAALYQSLGSYLMRVEEYDEAVKIWQEAAADNRLARFKALFLSRLADSQVEREDFDAALEAVKQARQLNNSPEFQFQEAWINYRGHRDEKAVELFELFRKTPSNPERLMRTTHLVLSNMYVQSGEIAKGEAVLEDWIKFDPDDPTVNNDLGYLYADQNKNLVQAEAMIRKAVAAEPENAPFLDSLGWILFRRGKFEEAATHLEKAVELLKNNDSTIRDHLGDCYQALKQDDKAIEQWTKALESEEKQEEPDEAIIKKLRKKLNLKPEEATPQKPTSAEKPVPAETAGE